MPRIQRIVASIVVAAAAFALADPVGDDAVAKLRAARPDLPIVGVSETPVPNLLGVELEGGAMLYATADGGYLIAGDLYRVTGTTLVNLAEEKRSAKRHELMSAIDLDDMVIFAPEKTRAVINVFTDVDCTFCRRLHQHMAEYNALGIEVRYLAYPRAGVGSESYDKIVSAWCSDDRQTAITELKAGKSIDAKTCSNPVAAQYKLGQTVGISGTPAIVTPDGRLLPGYVPPAELAAQLGI